MRIISWNCNGAFRKKHKALLNLDSDIYVIEECENPAISKDKDYEKFSKNYIWVGYKSKGLGIFTKDTITLKNNNWECYGLEWFISCTVNNKLTILGVWGSGNHIEDIYVYLQIHKEKLKNIDNILICGDFNSNSRWDKKHKRRTHSAVVKELESLNLYSCYHYINNDEQGKESEPTFYMYRNKNKPYHIDYCFYKKNKIKNLEIGKFEQWISLSDHMPMIIDIDDL